MNEEKLHRCLELLGWGAVIVVLVCILNSCAVCKHCTSTPLVDSIIINKTDTIIIRDTTLMYQPQDSTASNVVADTEKSHLETDLATSDAWVKDGKLHHNLSNKQDLIPINVSIPTYVSREEKYLFRTVTKKVNELTQLQVFWMVLGKIFACICIVIIIIQGVRRWIVR